MLICPWAVVTSLPDTTSTTGGSTWAMEVASLRAVAGLVGIAQGLGFVQGVQNAVDHIRPVEPGPKARRREEVRRCVHAPVDVPADQFFTTGGCVVVPRWRPQHPAFAVGMGEEGQQFLPVTHPVPAQGAIAIGGHDQAAISAEVDAPGGAGCRLFPQRLAGGGEMAQGPVCAQHQALPTRHQGQAAGHFVLPQLEWLAVEAGVGGVLPVLDLQAGHTIHLGHT
jgi:hypothetical protein